MNEIGKQAREAAIDHGMWLAPDDDETNYQAFVAGYLRGYSDRGVEATAARDEYEKEIATLHARVVELEGMAGRNHNDGDCDATDRGFICTRIKGHTGNHVAHGFNDREVVSW